MYLLALESTAHTFGSSVIKYNNRGEFKILSNIKKTLTSKSEGLIPIKIQEHHTKNSKEIIEESLKKAKTKIEKINIIAYSNSPGMGHALRTSNIIAKTLSLKYNIPIVKVNHSLAHLTSGIILFKQKNQKNVVPNLTLLYTSGANTQIYNYEKKTSKLKLVGETLDIGLGHLLDIIARLFNYGFPGGPKIEEEAKKYEKKCKNYNDCELIELPYNIKGMDVVLGGLYSKIKTLYENKKELYEQKEITKKELEEYKRKLCFSTQEHTFSLLLEALERAISLNKSEGFTIIGGVAMNETFTKKAKQLARQKKLKLKIPKKELLVDNAAMIGIEAIRLMFKEKIKLKTFKEIKSLKPNPYERLEYEFKYKI